MQEKATEKSVAFSLVSESDSIFYLTLLSWKQADNSGSDDFLKDHTQKI